MATLYTEAETVIDTPRDPKVTLTRSTNGKLTAVIEVAGLTPDRAPNAEERKLGITSLDPPTVESRSRADRNKTLRVLLDGSWRAVAEAVAATPGQAALTPADLATIGHRVTMAVRAALRAVGEDI
jgi:hypothetical protein